ncbi:Ubiquitin recognition factor in ER-associated degradation protein 1 [Glycine max]|nr:Ubiquitin recognition factor in ER-associated degradation protein 1 [Glycine max]
MKTITVLTYKSCNRVFFRSMRITEMLNMQTFEQFYRCYPVSFIEKPDLEKGDKIIMPPSALDRLDDGKYASPRGRHCKSENCHPCKRNVCEAAASHKGFFWISPIQKPCYLETTLRSYSCLTAGDTIMVPYNNKKYYIDIVETIPSPAVIIIETDCEVDFAPPLDYKEPEKQAKPVVFDRKQPEVEDEPPAKIARLTPFTVSGRHLDGKPSAQSVEQASSSELKQKQTDKEIKGSDSKSSNTVSRRHSGKLVFGSNATTSDVQTTPKVSQENTCKEKSQKEQEPKFKAFTGKKYSLKS